MSMDKLYDQNIIIFKQYNLALSSIIESASLDEFEILHTNDDQFIIKYKNENLYDYDPKLSALAQVENYKLNPKSFSMLPVISKGSNSDLHDKHINKLEKLSPAIDKNGNYLFKGICIHNNQIPLLIMSGCGAGYQLIEMIKNFEIFNLVIYDENYSFVKLSMHFINWEPILKYFSQPNRSLTIIADKSPAITANLILNKIKIINPILVTNLYFFQHLNSKFLSDVMSDVLRDGYLLVLGWGFYDDEIISLSNTIANSKLGLKYFSCENEDIAFTNNIPIVIVGSGPSLDKDIEVIKKLENKAVICSAGSALSALFKNNITPNFHFEVERMPVKSSDGKDISATYQALSMLPNEYLNKINFIGLNVLLTEVFSLFEKKFIFFRNNDAGFTVVSPNKVSALKVTNPSVANAIVSFAILLKFKKIYLFGLDNGYKSKTSGHHSKHSLYYIDKPEYVDDLNLNIEEFQKVKGNFCEEVITDISLSWIREVMEAVLKKKTSKVKVYNCSDGAFIENTIPKKSNSIKLNKSYDAVQIEDTFLKYFIEIPDNQIISSENISIVVHSVINDILILKKIFQQYQTRIGQKEFYIFMQNIFHFLDKQTAQPTKSLIKGTIMVLTSYAYMHTSACPEKKLNEQYIENYFEIAYEFLCDAEDDLRVKLEQWI